MTMTKRPRASKIDFSKSISLTEQHHKDRCDIKKIVANARKTGLLSHLNHNQPRYSDLPDVPSFHEAMNIVATAASTFENLPADFRQDMNNDPAEFLDFIQDADNIEEIEAYGFSTEHLTPPKAPPIPESKPAKDDAE